MLFLAGDWIDTVLPATIESAGARPYGARSILDLGIALQPSRPPSSRRDLVGRTMQSVIILQEIAPRHNRPCSCPTCAKCPEALADRDVAKSGAWGRNRCRSGPTARGRRFAIGLQSVRHRNFARAGRRRSMSRPSAAEICDSRHGTETFRGVRPPGRQRFPADVSADRREWVPIKEARGWEVESGQTGADYSRRALTSDAFYFFARIVVRRLPRVRAACGVCSRRHRFTVRVRMMPSCAFFRPLPQLYDLSRASQERLASS